MSGICPSRATRGSGVVGGQSQPHVAEPDELLRQIGHAAAHVLLRLQTIRNLKIGGCPGHQLGQATGAGDQTGLGSIGAFNNDDGVKQLLVEAVSPRGGLHSRLVRLAERRDPVAQRFELTDALPVLRREAEQPPPAADQSTAWARAGPMPIVGLTRHRRRAARLAYLTTDERPAWPLWLATERQRRSCGLCRIEDIRAWI